jgi:uncharacterized delta-60 repeat protein
METRNRFATSLTLLALGGCVIVATLWTGGRVAAMGHPGATTSAFANASALQPDGKIIAAGGASLFTQPGDIAFRLVRYDPDGSVDTTFGMQGIVTTNVSEGPEGASAVAIQSDGKIVAAGSAGLGPQASRFALVRYHRDGALDTDFGVGGIVITDLSGPHEGAAAVAIQSDGRIVAAGAAYASALWASGDVALVRYEPDGSLDRTFGIEGKVITDWSGVHDTARALAILPDGRIVAAGTSSFRDRPGYGLVARYNKDGSVDTSFGERGRVMIQGVDASDVSALIVQSDGKIIAAGGFRSRGSSLDFGLVRYNDDGSLDSTFGAGGTVTTSFGPWQAGVFALSLQPDGKIVAGGVADLEDYRGAAFGLARYARDGSLDTSFGSGGKVRAEVPAGTGAYLRSLGIQRDGTIVAVGSSNPDLNLPFLDIELARYDSAGVLLGRPQSSVKR